MRDSDLSGLMQEEYSAHNIEDAELQNLPQNKDPGIQTEKEENTGMFSSVEEITKEPKEYITDKTNMVKFLLGNPGITGSTMILIGGITLMWPVWLSLLLIGVGGSLIWNSITK